MSPLPDAFARAPATDPDGPWIEELRQRPALVVLSHLRWDVGVRRPQQLLSRLAADFDVYLVEEPMPTEDPAHLVSRCPMPGIEVLVPHTPLVAPGFADEQIDALRGPLVHHLAERGVAEPVVWLTTPLALPLAEDLEPSALIYDCMDDLAATHGAPATLHAREAELLDEADLVLTAAPSLHAARAGRHANVHCLPSAVEAGHWSPERLSGLAAARSPEAVAARAVHATVPRPRLGFFGIVDARLDVALLGSIADRRPEWQVVMAGPIVGIDPATLPRRPNLHWVGLQDHDTLPHLVAQWDVCLLPFARTAAARYVNPARVLEYLAAGKPVVSTPVADVDALYGPLVHFAGDAEAFVTACAAAMDEPGAARKAHEARARETVEACSWDATVARIRELLAPFVPGAFERAAAARVADAFALAATPVSVAATAG